MEAKSFEEKPVLERLPVRRVTVRPEEAGMRLDRYLADCNPGAPMGLIQRWLRTGQTRVDGGRVRGGFRLEAGQEVRLPPFLPREAPAGVRVPEGAIQAMAGAILWRDGQLLVANKPCGMPVHGGSGQEWGCVDAMRALLEREGMGVTPELCHRLDKETSGCLLFALDKGTARRLTGAFRQGAVEKEYLALVRGVPARESGRIDRALIKGEIRGGERMVVAGGEGGLNAVTRYRVMARYADAALVACWPDTGRTHQLRVHWQWAGHPLAGDEKYGDPLFNRLMRQGGLNRMFLHARRIGFVHPGSGQPFAVEAPLDPALERFLKRLASSSACTGGEQSVCSR